MVDIKQYLDEYKSWIVADPSRQSDAVFIRLPMFFYGYDESIAIKVTEKDGNLILSDCHSTFDYFEYLDIEFDDYRVFLDKLRKKHGEKLDRIMKTYGIILDGNVFRMTVSGTDYCSFARYLGYFIQALALIANIDL